MKRNTTIALVGLALSLSGAAHGATINAVANGLLNATNTWGVGSMPGAPDSNVWNANGFNLGVGTPNHTTETFFGSELVLPAGSELNGSVNWYLTLQALTFDGGSLIKNNNAADDFDFSGQPITITANGATFSSLNRNHNMILKNGTLLGSGDIVYSRIAGGGSVAGNSQLIFEDTVVMSNYTGTMIVSNNVGSAAESWLYINGETTGSFGVEVTTGARLAMNGTNTYDSLVLGGETIPDGDYTSMASFTLPQQAFLVGEGGVIIVGAGGDVEDNPYVAVQDGNMNDGTTWAGGAAPVAGDTNTWVSGGFNIDFTNQTFEGETLVISSGDEFYPGVAGADPTVRNLTFDGGLLFNKLNTPCEIDLSGSNLTITATGAEFRSNKNGRNILIKNGVLVGEGDLAIKYNSASGQGKITFDTDTVLTNFTGTVNVGVNNTNGIAVAAFNGLTDGSFGVNFAVSTKIDLSTAMTNYFDSVTFGTNSLPDGSYTTVQLGALGYADYVLGNNGTVIVGDFVPVPDPELWPAELFIDAAAGSITISTTNLNPDVRVTNTLQAADSLTPVSWDAVATVVGVSETNWVITASNSASFYQIESGY